MSRQYNNHSESVEYSRRSNQPYDTAPHYASRESPRAYPMSRTSPDQGSEKGEQQPRRRIGLACSRCRKRKIKCSGDIAGLGCQNCKNAGAEECNFLRVNSTNILAPTSTIDYPYSSTAASSLPASMSRGNSGMSTYFPGGYGTMQPPAPYPGTSQGARIGSCNGQHYSSLTSRHSQPSVAHTYNYTNLEDNAFDHYTQAPHYLPPAQDLQPSMSSTYGTQDISRQWTPIASSRHPASGLDDPSFKYGSSGFPYLNSSAVASVGPDGFGMNSLGRALPRHGDRVLPNPRRTSVETSNSYQKSGESASYGFPPGLGRKSSAAWSPQTLTNGASQGSVSSTSLSAVSGPLSSVSSSPPTEPSQNTTAFGYVPLSSSPLSHSLSVSHAPELESLHHTADNRSTFGEVPYPKTRPILPLRSPSSLYSWDKTSSTTDSLGSDHTLVSGKQYRRIQQQPIKHNPGDPLPVERAPSLATTQQSTPVTTQSRQR